MWQPRLYKGLHSVDLPPRRAGLLFTSEESVPCPELYHLPVPMQFPCKQATPGLSFPSAVGDVSSLTQAVPVPGTPGVWNHLEQ